MLILICQIVLVIGTIWQAKLNHHETVEKLKTAEGHVRERLLQKRFTNWIVPVLALSLAVWTRFDSRKTSALNTLNYGNMSNNWVNTLASLNTESNELMVFRKEKAQTDYSDEEKQSAIKYLSKFAGTPFSVICLMSDAGSGHFAEKTRDVLSTCGWQWNYFGFGNDNISGVAIYSNIGSTNFSAAVNFAEFLQSKGCPVICYTNTDQTTNVQVIIGTM
jgi:hypothetical protein